LSKIILIAESAEKSKNFLFDLLKHSKKHFTMSLTFIHAIANVVFKMTLV